MTDTVDDAQIGPFDAQYDPDTDSYGVWSPGQFLANGLEAKEASAMTKFLNRNVNAYCKGFQPLASENWYRPGTSEWERRQALSAKEKSNPIEISKSRKILTWVALFPVSLIYGVNVIHIFVSSVGSAWPLMHDHPIFSAIYFICLGIGQLPLTLPTVLAVSCVWWAIHYARKAPQPWRMCWRYLYTIPLVLAGTNLIAWCCEATMRGWIDVLR